MTLVETVHRTVYKTKLACIGQKVEGKQTGVGIALSRSFVVKVGRAYSCNGLWSPRRYVFGFVSLFLKSESRWDRARENESERESERDEIN